MSIAEPGGGMYAGRQMMRSFTSISCRICFGAGFDKRTQESLQSPVRLRVCTSLIAQQSGRSIYCGRDQGDAGEEAGSWLAYPACLLTLSA